MAWNKPGDGGRDNSPRIPRQPDGGGGGRNPLDGLLSRVGGVFNGGSPLRWIGILLALWLIFGSSGIKRLILRFRHGPADMTP